MVPISGSAAGSTTKVRLTPSAVGLSHSAAATLLAAASNAATNTARALKLRIQSPVSAPTIRDDSLRIHRNLPEEQPAAGHREIFTTLCGKQVTVQARAGSRFHRSPHLPAAPAPRGRDHPGFASRRR